jgi:hypothetical protein
MQINADKSMQDFAEAFQAFTGTKEGSGEIAKNGFNHISDKVEFNMGPSLDSRGNDCFEIDAHAPHFPLAVDKMFMGEEINKTALVMDAAKKNPESALMGYKWNRKTGKLDIYYDAKDKISNKYVGDSARLITDGKANDAINLINAQLFSPASMGWISKPFYQVLGYSRAMQAVTVETGNNPFASALNLPLISFGGGFATMSGAGGFNNNDTFDVEARSDMMSNTVLNFEATYRLTVEEKARQEYGQVAPFGGQVLSAKIKYSSWVMDMFRDVLIWYGNTSTGTIGILNANSIVAWGSGGFGTKESLNYISRNNVTNPGAVAYNNLALAVVQFLTVNQNKPTLVKIFVSPLAYNLLGSMAYSSTYSAESALQALVNNFLAGAGPADTTPKIEIIPEPLLSASVNGITNIWNANTYDYMVILSPEIGGGIPDEAQKTIIAGIPLQKYMFPTVPGTYQTQYKMLSRYAGLFIPATMVVAVYSGFGVLTSTT